MFLDFPLVFPYFPHFYLLFIGFAACSSLFCVLFIGFLCCSIGFPAFSSFFLVIHWCSFIFFTVLSLVFFVVLLGFPACSSRFLVFHCMFVTFSYFFQVAQRFSLLSYESFVLLHFHLLFRLLIGFPRAKSSCCRCCCYCCCWSSWLQKQRAGGGLRGRAQRLPPKGVGRI